MPDTWTAVADVDVLHREGIAFPEKLQNAGFKITVKENAKTPHTLLPVDKLLGLLVIDDVVDVVRTEVDPRQEQWVSDHAHVPVRSDC